MLAISNSSCCTVNTFCVSDANFYPGDGDSSQVKKHSDRDHNFITGPCNSFLNSIIYVVHLTKKFFIKILSASDFLNFNGFKNKPPRKIIHPIKI